MRFVRLAVLVFSRGAPLTDWLRGPDGVTCALRVSALAAGTAVVHRSSVAGGSVRDSHDTLALGWACLPYEVDNSGTYGLLADANLWCGMVCAWATGRTASEGWQLCAPAARTIFVTTYTALRPLQSSTRATLMCANLAAPSLPALLASQMRSPGGASR